MLKYYLLLFVVVGVALFYVYVSDPCNQLVRMEFASRYPDYTILESGAEEGSRESVRCRIAYRKPGSEQVHDELWLYLHQGHSWEFSKVIETRSPIETRSQDQKL